MIKRYVVKGHSMEPSFYEGDRLLVSSLFFGLKEGDVVVFSICGRDCIKRVTAAGKNGFTVVGDNRGHSRSYTIERRQIKGKLLMNY